MATDTLPIPAPPGRKPIASFGHTVVLILFLDGLSIAGWLAQRALDKMHMQSPPQESTVKLWIWGIAFEWATVAWVWFGVRRQGIRISDLIGGRWATGRAILRDASLGAALWILWILISTAWHYLLGHDQVLNPEPFPVGWLQVLLWIGLSVSAGFCEEIVFRGYFQRQFFAWCGNLKLAIVLQAVAFGVAHLMHGAMFAAKVTLYGVLFGTLASWQKSLRPGIIGHVWHDLAARLLRLR